MNGRTIAYDSGSTVSTWMSERVPTCDAEIPEDARPDVCVIGAGIAGLSVAPALVRDGLDVLVLDQGPIGGGQTARTSAHLASALDDYFHGAVAGLLWEAMRHALVWYFGTLSQVSVVYGAFATTIAILLSLEIAAIVLLLGAQVIAVYERRLAVARAAAAKVATR